MTPGILSEAGVRFFHENGYLILPKAVPPENLAAVIAAIWDFQEMDPDDPSTWYPPDRRGAIVHLHQHPALWANRQHPRVPQAFAGILGTEKLWVSMDRAGMKPPIDCTSRTTRTAASSTGTWTPRSPF